MKSGWTFTACVYCGREARASDHLRPRSRGGSDAQSNLVPACHPCNSSKGSKLLTEWDAVRVAHGVLRDPRVKAEWDSLALLQKRSPIVPGGPRPHVEDAVLEWRSPCSGVVYEHAMWLVTPPRRTPLAVVLEWEGDPGVLQNMAEVIAAAVAERFPERVTVLHAVDSDDAGWWHAVPIVGGRPDFGAGTSVSVLDSLAAVGLLAPV